jgi:cation diffusion facilitator CzcD-associated flavoprotein CzcO
LACAAALRARGRASLVLEKADHLAASWHRHYDRLHLHTDKIHSGLPGKTMPRHYPKYPSRLQFIAYLDDYARSYDLEIRCGVAATTIRKDGTWIVESTGETFRAENVIVATGLANVANRPAFKGQEQFKGKVLHSCEFRNAAQLEAGRVLVVGFGNSAGEIALECAEAGLIVGLSVRSPVNVVPREIFGMPAVSLAVLQQFFPNRMVDAVNAPFLRWCFGDIGKFGLEWAREGPVTTIMKQGRTPLINIGTMERIRSGDIQVFRQIAHCEDGRVQFVDGRREAFDAIVLATGYRPALETLLPDFAQRIGGAKGSAKWHLQPAPDGLYFCGFNVVATGLLRQIGKEAQQIATAIARN